MRHDHHRGGGRLDRLRALLMPNCREMTRLTSRSLDGPLPLLQQLGAAVHLAVCRLCRRYREQLQWLRRAALKSSEALREAPADPPRLPEAARARLRQTLRERAAAAGAAEGHPGCGSTGSESEHDDHR